MSGQDLMKGHYMVPLASGLRLELVQNIYAEIRCREKTQHTNLQPFHLLISKKSSFYTSILFRVRILP